MPKLTDAEKQEIQARWRREIDRTEPLTQEEAETCSKLVYKFLGREAPAVEIHPSPVACWERVVDIIARDKEEHERLLKNITLPDFDGNFDYRFYAYVETEYKESGVMADLYECLPTFKSVNWNWPLDDFHIFSDFPAEIHIEDGRLSNREGPSLRYRDGLSMFHIDGYPLPPEVVTDPQSMDVKRDIMEESNPDIQAIKAEQYGWLSILKQIDAKLLDERENPIEGTYEVLYDSPLGRKFVATCVTGKIPVMSVPPQVNTCEEAALWLSPVACRIIGAT